MVYDKSIVDVLSNALSTGMSTLENMDYPSEFKINIASVCLSLYYDKGIGRKDCQMIIHDPTIDGQYIAVWKSYAPGHFMPRDWKKEIRDKKGNSPYYVVHYKHGKHNMKALLRRLFELNESASEKLKHELNKEYDDLTVDGQHYAIIKICNEEKAGNDWLTVDKVCRDIMHATYIDTVDTFGNMYRTDYSDCNEPENVPEENPLADEEETHIQSNTLL